MVKKFTCFLFLIAFVCMYSNAQSLRTYDVYKTNATIVIDGEVDPIWEMVDTLNCSYYDEGSPPEDEWDFNTYCRMLWDDNTVYMLGIINDDYLPDSIDYDAGVDEWNNDNVEVYFDPANAKTNDMNNHTQMRFQYIRTAPYYDVWSEGGFNVTDPVIDWEKTMTDDGWNLEVAFSLTNLMASIDSTIGEDYQMGWNICAIDNDDPVTNERNCNLRWVETGGDSWNHGDLMGTITFKSEIISDIKDVTKTAGLKVYPNPAKDYIRISDISDVQRIEISNLIGQEIWAVDNPASNIINIAKLPRGIYLIKLYSDKTTVSTVKISKK
jgi:hypothetical protein